MGVPRVHQLRRTDAPDSLRETQENPPRISRKKKNPAFPSGKAGYTKSKAGGRKGQALLTVSPASQIFSSPGLRYPYFVLPQSDGTPKRAMPVPSHQPMTNVATTTRYPPITYTLIFMGTQK